jgi:hypothetical protein
MIIIGRDTPELQFPTVLEYEEWSRIAQATNLPDDARTEEVRAHINDFIGFYHQSQSTAKSQKTACKKLQDTKNVLPKCCESLHDLLSDLEIFAAIAIGFDGQMKIPPELLSKVQSHLQKVYQTLYKDSTVTLHVLDKALKRVRRTKHGPRTGRDSLDLLVRLLNSLLKQYIRQRIVRSGNHVKEGHFHSTTFVWEICHIANDKIPKATVINAIKRVVTEDRNEQEWGIDTSDQLLPLTKKSGKVPLRGKSRALIFLPIPGYVKLASTKDYVSWRVSTE